MSQTENDPEKRWKNISTRKQVWLSEKESKRKLGGSGLDACAIQGRFSEAPGESLSQPVSCQLSLTFFRNGLALCILVTLSLGWSSSEEVWPEHKQRRLQTSGCIQALDHYSSCIWKAVRCIFMATISIFTLRWCQSQIHSWLLPARNSISLVSSLNVKLVVFQPLFFQKARQLSIGIGNSTGLWTYGVCLLKMPLSCLR